MIQAGTADCFEQRLDKRKNIALIDQRRGKARMRGKGEGKEARFLTATEAFAPFVIMAPLEASERRDLVPVFPGIWARNGCDPDYQICFISMLRICTR